MNQKQILIIGFIFISRIRSPVCPNVATIIWQIFATGILSRDGLADGIYGNMTEFVDLEIYAGRGAPAVFFASDPPLHSITQSSCFDMH